MLHRPRMLDLGIGLGRATVAPSVAGCALRGSFTVKKVCQPCPVAPMTKMPCYADAGLRIWSKHADAEQTGGRLQVLANGYGGHGHTHNAQGGHDHNQPPPVPVECTSGHAMPSGGLQPGERQCVLRGSTNFGFFPMDCSFQFYAPDQPPLFWSGLPWPGEPTGWPR